MGDGSAAGRLSVALVGTRGVPARYGGFETAIDEIGRRLVEMGVDVTVYRRAAPEESTAPRTHEGMRLVTLPALRSRSLETLSHTALSVAHLSTRRRPDAVIVFNAANAVFLPLLRLRRLRAAVHVDGLEWRRSKWSGAGRRYYRVAESLAVRWADQLIADARGIADYYAEEFGATTRFIPYGAPVLHDVATDGIRSLGLEPDGFHLVVSRFEPENHVELVVEGYRRSEASLPLVVVGSAPYSDAYTDRVRSAAAGDPRIRLLGAVWDQDLLDEMYAHARLYLHGHSVGGTNPSLLRAMGAGAAVSAYDVVFNHEMIGDGASYFSDEREVVAAVMSAERDPAAMHALGRQVRERAATRYRWDDVASGYAGLVADLAGGASRRGEASGRRRGDAGRSRRRVTG